jgi:hypothetical protein
MWEPLAPPLHHQSPPTKPVPVAPPMNSHMMTTRAKLGFRLLTDKLTLTSNLSLVPSSVHAALIDLNLRHAVKKEFATLITNNTWDLGPCPSPCWLQCCHQQMGFQAQVQLRWLFGMVQGLMGPSQLHPAIQRRLQ